MTSWTPIAFLDTETTGVHPGRLPWEIAIIRREPTGDESTWIIQIEDIDLTNADPFGLNISGFYQRHTLAGGEPGPAKTMTEAEAAPIVEHMTRDAHIIGAVPNFDTETLAAMLRRHRLTPAWHYHLIDIEALAVGYLANRGIPVDLPWNSDALSRQCGIDPPTDDDRHTAHGDTLWVKRWFDAITLPIPGHHYHQP